MATDRGVTPRPGLDALAELTGIDRDELLRHPRLLLTALGRTGHDVFETALGLVDEDAGTQGAARARHEAIVDILSRGTGEPATRSRLLDLLDRATAAIRETSHSDESRPG